MINYCIELKTQITIFCSPMVIENLKYIVYYYNKLLFTHNIIIILHYQVYLEYMKECVWLGGRRESWDMK